MDSSHSLPSFSDFLAGIPAAQLKIAPPAQPISPLHTILQNPEPEQNLRVQKRPLGEGVVEMVVKVRCLNSHAETLHKATKLFLETVNSELVAPQPQSPWIQQMVPKLQELLEGTRMQQKSQEFFVQKPQELPASKPQNNIANSSDTSNIALDGKSKIQKVFSHYAHNGHSLLYLGGSFFHILSWIKVPENYREHEVLFYTKLESWSKKASHFLPNKSNGETHIGFSMPRVRLDEEHLINFNVLKNGIDRFNLKNPLSQRPLCKLKLELHLSNKEIFENVSVNLPKSIDSQSIILMTFGNDINDLKMDAQRVVQAPEGYRRLTCLEAAFALVYIRGQAEVCASMKEKLVGLKGKFIVCEPIYTNENPKGDVYVGLNGNFQQRIVVTSTANGTVINEQKMFLFCREILANSLID